MKTALVRVLPVLFFCTLTKFAAAGDFVSQVVQTTQPITVTVPSDRFLVIRNFTQESTSTTPATMRGYVSVTSPYSAIVLTATLVDPTNANQGSLEVINNVVIAGPATVIVTPGDTNGLITYRKGTD